MLDLHARTIGALTKELAENGRLSSLPDMPQRSYVYIAQNRSVRTCVANAETGERVANISNKKPDIVAVWFDPATNRMGVDMFEVPSGSQTAQALNDAMDTAWNTLPLQLRQHNDRIIETILRRDDVILPALADLP